MDLIFILSYVLHTNCTIEKEGTASEKVGP